MLPKEFYKLPQSQYRPFEEKMVYLKYVRLGSGWTYFVTEGVKKGDDFIMFGFVTYETGEEWRHFSLSEIKDTVHMEMKATPFWQVIAEFESIHGPVEGQT